MFIIFAAVENIVFIVQKMRVEVSNKQLFLFVAPIVCAVDESRFFLCETNESSMTHIY